MESIVELLKTAFNLGIEVTEIKLTKDQTTKIIQENGSVLLDPQERILEKLYTDFGEVRVVVKE